jgi:hypothetical protein
MEGYETGVRNGPGEPTLPNVDMYYREFKAVPNATRTSEPSTLSRWPRLSRELISNLSQLFNLPRLELKKWVQKILIRADIRIGGGRPWDITVHNDRFYARVLRLGSLGLGESYMDGVVGLPRAGPIFFQDSQR